MGKKEENTAFICAVCKKNVPPVKSGYRNHCPNCLFSLHVDEAVPGDRKSICKGIMQPIGIQYSGKKGWQIIHKCLKCGKERPNKIAEEERFSDNWDQIISLSIKKG